MMTREQFDGLQVGDLLVSASGKTWRVVRSVADQLEASGRYVYAVRCNEHGGSEGLTKRELGCGVAIRVHTAKYTVVAR